jgi:hypothetical protein
MCSWPNGLQLWHSAHQVGSQARLESTSRLQVSQRGIGGANRRRPSRPATESEALTIMSAVARPHLVQLGLVAVVSPFDGSSPPRTTDHVTGWRFCRGALMALLGYGWACRPEGSTDNRGTATSRGWRRGTDRDHPGSSAGSARIDADGAGSRRASVAQWAALLRYQSNPTAARMTIAMRAKTIWRLPFLHQWKPRRDSAEC